MTFLPCGRGGIGAIIDYTNIISRISLCVKPKLSAALHKLYNNYGLPRSKNIHMTTKSANRSVFINEPIRGARIYKLYFVFYAAAAYRMWGRGRISAIIAKTGRIADICDNRARGRITVIQSDISPCVRCPRETVASAGSSPSRGRVWGRVCRRAARISVSSGSRAVSASGRDNELRAVIREPTQQRYRRELALCRQSRLWLVEYIQPVAVGNDISSARGSSLRATSRAAACRHSRRSPEALLPESRRAPRDRTRRCRSSRRAESSRRAVGASSDDSQIFVQ